MMCDTAWNLLFARANGKCELTNITFDQSPYPAASRRPYAASIDRIRSDLGYTYDNCRVVCVAANIALSDFGEEVLARISKEFLKQREQT